MYPESEILMITSNGQAVRCPLLNIRETNRGSKGVKLVNLEKNDMLLGISEVIELDEEELVEKDTTGMKEFHQLHPQSKILILSISRSK